jgi:hypothetical protein
VITVGGGDLAEVMMRGTDKRSGELFSYVDLETISPERFSIRPWKRLVRALRKVMKAVHAKRAWEAGGCPPSASQLASDKGPHAPHVRFLVVRRCLTRSSWHALSTRQGQ